MQLNNKNTIMQIELYGNMIFIFKYVNQNRFLKIVIFKVQNYNITNRK